MRLAFTRRIYTVNLRWCAVQDSKEVLYIRFLFAVSVLLDIS